MIRHWFFAISALLVTGVVLAASIWPPIHWSFVFIAPFVTLGMHDAFQKQHTVLRNFPIIGHLRYLLELVRPEIQQYFIESNIDAYPVEREFRSLAYQRAKGALETRPFGTQRDVYRIGYEWVSHSLHPVDPPIAASRVKIGGPD